MHYRIYEVDSFVKGIFGNLVGAWESGNRVYFCMKYETGSTKEGSFGPILTAVIP
jgi:hypothetical protein